MINFNINLVLRLLQGIIFILIISIGFGSCGVCSVWNKQKTSQADQGFAEDSVRILSAIEDMDTARIPHFLIDINIHFVKHPELGTFYRGKPEDSNIENGLHWARLLINHVNWALDSLGTSPLSSSNVKGDAHYNFNLYTESTNTQDSFGGIWFWDRFAPAIYPYGDRVLNIVLQDDGKRMLNGAACGLDFCNVLTLYGAYHNVKYKGKFGWWAFASLLNHEVGHIMGLCHSFYCGNPCAGIDLDPAKECHEGPCYNDCGGPNNGVCNNWNSGSQNMMGYNSGQNALTPCQWKLVMRNLFQTKSKFIRRLPFGQETGD